MKSSNKKKNNTDLENNKKFMRVQLSLDIENNTKYVYLQNLLAPLLLLLFVI
jgi:hypothetical protein